MCTGLATASAKRTAKFTLRFKMRLEINRESSLLKYRRNRIGVRFATWFLVGRVRDSLFTPALVRSWRSIKLPFLLAANWPLSPGEEITAACADQFTERRVAWTVPVSSKTRFPPASKNF